MSEPPLVYPIALAHAEKGHANACIPAIDSDGEPFIWFMWHTVGLRARKFFFSPSGEQREIAALAQCITARAYAAQAGVHCL